jgi:hypothetical protein
MKPCQPAIEAPSQQWFFNETLRHMIHIRSGFDVFCYLPTVFRIHAMFVSDKDRISPGQLLSVASLSLELPFGPVSRHASQ